MKPNGFQLSDDFFKEKSLSFNSSSNQFPQSPPEFQLDTQSQKSEKFHNMDQAFIFQQSSSHPEGSPPHFSQCFSRQSVSNRQSVIQKEEISSGWTCHGCERSCSLQ